MAIHIDQPLTVEVYYPKADSEESQELQNTAKQWERVALQKWRQSCAESDKGLFRDSKQVCKALVEQLSEKQPLRSRIYLCKDKEGHLRGIATISWRSNLSKVVLKLIATNPLNLNSSLNKAEDRKIRGAGSLLIKRIEADVPLLAKSKLLISDPLLTAIPFYKKIGFDALENGTLIKVIRMAEVLDAAA